MSRRKGSAIVGAIWMLAVLSILIATYAVDAQLQTRVNLYLQERVKVDHLTDAGIAIAEVILLDYQSVTVPATSEGVSGGNGASESEIEEFVEKDRWYWEKVELKNNRECSTGAVPVDALNPEGGTVTVKIKPIESQWNINGLAGRDSDPVWHAILAKSGVPLSGKWDELWDSITASWYDWRDTDDNNSGEIEAETGTFYKEAYEDYINGRDVEKNKNYLPAARNGEISDLDDLMHIRGFNEYEDEPINAQALLDGGILNPLAKKEDQVKVKGFRKYFTVFGSGKINVNIADADTISTIPGFFNPQNKDPDDITEDDMKDAEAVGEAIANQLRSKTDLRNTTLSGGGDEDYQQPTSMSELRSLLEKEVGTTLEVDWTKAEQYISFVPEMFFEISITGASLGITHTVKAVAIVEENKIRYIRWQEDP